jgi:hypothetical protein
VLRLLDPTPTGAAIRGERVIGKVGEILEGARIEDLVIPTPRWPSISVHGARCGSSAAP